MTANKNRRSDWRRVAFGMAPRCSCFDYSTSMTGHVRWAAFTTVNHTGAFNVAIGVAGESRGISLFVSTGAC
jgi:hypothetical protein